MNKLHSTKHRFANRKLLLALSLVVVASIGGAVFYFNKQSSVAKIETSIVSDVAKGGRVYRNDAGTSGQEAASQRQFTAKPSEKITYESRELPIQSRANAAVLSWKQSGKDGVQFEVRTRNNDSWSPWTKIEAEDPGKDGAKADLSTAIVLAKNIDDFQYRVVLRGSPTTPSSSVDLTNSSLVAIDSSQGPSGEKSLIDKLLGAISPNASAAVAAPSIITREQWGSPEPNWSTWPPEYAKLGRVILHHTATTESGDSYADVRAIWQYHARTLGWGDIGYHYIIDSAGRIFQGRYYNQNYARSNRVEVIGGHAYNNNVGTVGISMIGNYVNQIPTGIALESMAKMTGFKLAPYNINPSGNGPFGEAVVGHYAVYPTSCPGRNIISQLGNIKARASEFYVEYARNNGFTSMLRPRWMRLSRDVHKIDVDTGVEVDGIIPKGTDIKFYDKYDSKTSALLRTQHDYTNYIRKGIPFDALADIEPEPITTDTWMTTTASTYKVNPAIDAIDWSYQVPSGAGIKFTSKLTINGQTYYRTASDTAANRSLFIKDIRLKPTDYETFMIPRYMDVTTETAKQNPFSGEVSQETLKPGHHKFVKKIHTDKVYFQIASDADSKSVLAVPSSSLREVSLDAMKPVWRALSKDTKKINPQTLEYVGDTFKAQDVTSVRFVNKLVINGAEYYQTQFDATRGNSLVFAVADLKDVVYEPMSIPRKMSTMTTTNIIDPRTDDIIGSITKGTTTFYNSKITVGGKTYLRNSEDTTNDLNRAVLLTTLADTP